MRHQSVQLSQMRENSNSEDLRGQVSWNAEYSVFWCPYVCLVCIRFPSTKHFIQPVWEAYSSRSGGDSYAKAV